MVQDPTHNAGGTLDLILLSHPDRLIKITPIAPFPSCDHYPIVLSLSYAIQPLEETETVKYDWAKGDYASINRSLCNIDWYFALQHLDPKSCYAYIFHELTILIQLYIPLKTPSRTRPLWVVSRGLTKAKVDAWKSYKRIRNMHGRNSPRARKAYSEVTSANINIKYALLANRRAHERQLVSNLKNKPKAFHQYIGRMKKCPTAAGPLTVGALTMSDPLIMIKAFNAAFRSVYIASSASPPGMIHQTTPNIIDAVWATPAKVLKVIQGLKYDTSMGPDGIHSRLLKHCSQPLSIILSYVYNLSMLTGIVPDEWKLSHVIPIYKGGSRSNALQYRPISLSSLVCKVDERLIADDITLFCTENNVISEHQFGFVSGRSVEDSLLLTYDRIVSLVDSGQQCDLILFDFSKAFDKVSHPILLDKLSSLGIRGYLLAWIRDFLSNRFMTTRINGITSEPCPVTSGVPQGSVLGPLLFIIFINMITVGCKSQFSLFADDLKIFAVASTPRDCLLLQGDIDRLFINFTQHQVSFNYEKCSGLHFPSYKPPLRLGILILSSTMILTSISMSMSHMVKLMVLPQTSSITLLIDTRCS